MSHRSDSSGPDRNAVLQAVGFVSQLLREGLSWRDNVASILRHLAQASRVSRIYLFENNAAEDGTVATSQRFEWVAEGITPQIDNPDLQEIDLAQAGFQRWVDTLSAGRPIHGPVESFPPEEQELLTAQEIRSQLVVPIFVGRSWWGFIGFDDCESQRDWSVTEIQALGAAANILGAAIQRERMDQLEERLLHMARFDDLTDLPNRRAMREVMEKEHARSTRANKVYSIASLDLDHFKRVNDLHGHAAGDETLIRLSQVFQQAVRRGDWVGRWGGEEFLALLPETIPEKARGIMERLRSRVAAAKIPIARHRSVRLTVSIGVASYPSHGDGLEELLSAADRALYQAKGEGRNRVVVASPRRQRAPAGHSS